MGVLSEHFSGHLEEMRRRLLISFAAVIVCSAAAYLFSQQLTRLLVAPLFRAHPELSGLVYTNPTEAFIAYLKVALLVGLIFSLPVLVFQLWLFIAPGLHRHERRLALRVTGAGFLLFLAGALFAYWVVLPAALSFLMGFASERLVALPKLEAYLSFMVRSTLAFGLAFEVPFLMIIAERTGLVSQAYFARKRIYFYAANIVLALLLTAGDLFSAGLLAIPLFGLYEGGLLVMRFSGTRSSPS